MATAKRSTKKPARTKRPERSPIVGNVRKAVRQNAAAKSDFEAALTSLREALASLGQPYSVIGGMAVIAHGHVRTTQDIDIAWVPPLRNAPEVFIKHAAKFKLRPRIADANIFATENLVLLMEHQPTGIPVDISFALQDFERLAASNAMRMKVLGVMLPVVALNDLLVYKMIASRTQDIADVEMLLTSKAPIDNVRIQQTLAEFDSILETDRAGDFALLWRAARRRK
ncbi:MAG: hypothetical protein KBG15_05915 [Kofleriaceae bacterium]|nr:hypothetical protein [Kofleriaceae bacterium]